MYESNVLELWNLSSDSSPVVESQKILNIVGRFKTPEQIKKAFYTLNGRPEVPIYYNRGQHQVGRLSRFGDFNIDTINVNQLKKENCLRLRVVGRQETTDEVTFGYRKPLPVWIFIPDHLKHIGPCAPATDPNIRFSIIVYVYYLDIIYSISCKRSIIYHEVFKAYRVLLT